MAEFGVIVGVFISVIAGLWKDSRAGKRTKWYLSGSIWGVLISNGLTFICGVFVIINQNELNAENKGYLQELNSSNKRLAEMYSEGESMPSLMLLDVNSTDRRCEIEYHGQYPKSGVVFEVWNLEETLETSPNGIPKEENITKGLTRIPVIGDMNVAPSPRRRLVGFPWPNDTRTFRVDIVTRWKIQTQYIRLQKAENKWVTASIIVDNSNKILNMQYDDGFPRGVNDKPIWPVPPKKVGDAF